MNKPKLHKPFNRPRPNQEAPHISVDVFTIDEEGMHGLAFYSFTDERWYFHTETLIDVQTIQWRWYYPVVTCFCKTNHKNTTPYNYMTITDIDVAIKWLKEAAITAQHLSYKEAYPEPWTVSEDTLDEAKAEHKKIESQLKKLENLWKERLSEI